MPLATRPALCLAALVRGLLRRPLRQQQQRLRCRRLQQHQRQHQQHRQQQQQKKKTDVQSKTLQRWRCLDVQSETLLLTQRRL
jgi:hypothetical protein